MGRLRRALFTAGAVAVLYMGVEGYSARFAPEAMFARQRALIERHIRSTQQKKLRYEDLRQRLDQVRDASREQRCRVETLFEAELRTGSPEKAAEAIAHMSLRPYAHCEKSLLQELAEKWYNVVAAVVAAVGAIALVASFRRKQPDPLG